MPINNGVIKPLPRAQVPAWFGAACQTSNLGTATIPILGQMYVHKRVAQAFRNVLQSIADAGKAALIDRSDYGGTYNCRTVRGSTARSPHAWAIACDLNVHHFKGDDGRDEKRSSSNFRCSAADVAPSLEALAPYFESWGFSWGGRWNSYLDPMHYEATELTVKLLEGGTLSAAEQAAITEARQRIGQPVFTYDDGPVRVKINDEPFMGELRGGVTYLGPLPVRTFEELGCSVHNHIPDQRTVYVYHPPHPSE